MLAALIFLCYVRIVQRTKLENDVVMNLITMERRGLCDDCLIMGLSLYPTTYLALGSCMVYLSEGLYSY